MTSSLAPDAVSDTIVCAARSPTHFYVGFSSRPKKCMSQFCHIFCLKIQVELVLLQSLLLSWVSQPEALLSFRLTYMCPASSCWMVSCCSLSDAVYVLSSLSSGCTFSTVGFASVFSVLPLMVFPSPHSNRFILNWKWIFNCCFIDFGLMSLWCFTPLTWLFCRLCFLKTNDILHH